MMYPILCKVKFETLHLAFKTKELWIQIGFSIVMNWIVAPFLMVNSLCHVMISGSLNLDTALACSLLGLSP